MRGKTLNMDLRDQAVSAAIFAEGIWEPGETKFIEQSLQPGMVFVDIGANIGYYSLIASSLVGSTGKVFAFEPDPKNFGLLQRNVAANQCQNVFMVQKAVAAVTRQLPLYRSSDNFGDHRTYEPRDKNVRQRDSGPAPVAVEAVSLDEYLSGRLTNVDFIKMDIQGSEYDALVGMRRTLRQNPDVTILTEFWPMGLRQAGVAPDHFLDEVKAYGFMVHRLGDEGRPRESSVAEILSGLSGNEYTNLVLSRKKLPLF